MSHSDPTEILLAHNHWATRQVIDACDALTNEQFHQSFDIGPGSLHDTVTHILGAMRGWGDMLAQRDIRSRPEENRHTVDDLRTLLDEIAIDLSESARSHPNDEIVTATRGGKTYSFTRGGVLTHVTTHGMHHRGQCLNMLRHLRVDPLPPVSVVEWMLMVDPIH